MKKNTEPWKCPKGKYNFSTHRWKEIARKQIKKGVVESTRECKLCGKIEVATLDYMILSDLFSVPRRR